MCPGEKEQQSFIKKAYDTVFKEQEEICVL